MIYYRDQSSLNKMDYTHNNNNLKSNYFSHKIMDLFHQTYKRYHRNGLWILRRRLSSEIINYQVITAMGIASYMVFQDMHTWIFVNNSNQCNRITKKKLRLLL